MNRRYKGQITVFLSLTLMILISFLCTALRSAQLTGSRYLFTLATEAAARSVFGAYDTEVWEQYRILMLTDRELIREIGDQCASYYTDNRTLFPVEVTAVELNDAVTMTENGAQGWEDAAVSYMETRLPVDLAAQLMEQAGWLDGLEDMIGWMQKFRELLKPLLELEEKLCRLEKKISQAVDAYRQIRQLLSELRHHCSVVSQVLQTEDPAGLDEAWSALVSSYQRVQEYRQDSSHLLDRLREDSQENQLSVRELEEQVRQLSAALTGDVGGGLASLADLGGYLSGLNRRLQDLMALPEQLSEQKERLRRVSRITLPSMDAVSVEEIQQQLMELMEAAAGLAGEEWDMEDPDTEDAGATEDGQEGKVGILMRLKSWLDQGILALVLEDADQVSEGKLTQTIVRSERQEDDGLLDHAYRNLLYGEYALRYTTAYSQSEQDTVPGKEAVYEEETEGSKMLRYGNEYLIAGKESDMANLAAVASRLLLIRGVLNFAWLIQHASSNEGLQMTAAGLSAALGGWIPQGLMAVLLMVIWAMAEAVCDVRALMAGRHVPFWKDSSSWCLALEHLWTILEDGFVTGVDRREGMSYQEYLRLLLFAVPLTEKCYRTMELVQQQCQSRRADFQMQEAICRAVVLVKGRAAGCETGMSLAYGY